MSNGSHASPWRPTIWSRSSHAATCAPSTASPSQVEAGTVLGLLGPNGAGKTTAVRILSTILGPDSGHATILGHDVAKEADAVRRIIGLAGQYAAVDENLTGRENIRMVGRLTHMAGKAVRGAGPTSCWSSFGLTDAGDRRAQDLLGWHAPPARPGRRPGGPTARPLPRRAHHRARPPEPAGPVGDDRGPGGRRHHRAAHHPVPRGGRPPGPRHRGGRPRPGHRRGDAGRSSRPIWAPRSSRSPWPTPTSARQAAPLLGTAVGQAPARWTASWSSSRWRTGRRSAAEVLRALDAAQVPVAGLAAARAEPRRRLPEPHRSQGRGETDEERAAAAATPGAERRAGSRADRRRWTPHDAPSTAPRPPVAPAPSGSRLRWALADTATRHLAQPHRPDRGSPRPSSSPPCSPSCSCCCSATSSAAPSTIPGVPATSTT